MVLQAHTLRLQQILGAAARWNLEEGDGVLGLLDVGVARLLEMRQVLAVEVTVILQEVRVFLVEVVRGLRHGVHLQHITSKSAIQLCQNWTRKRITPAAPCLAEIDDTRCYHVMKDHVG